MGFVSQVCRLVLTKNACRGASGKKGRGREVLDPPLGRVFFLPVCQPAFFSFAGLPAGLCSSRFWDHGRTVMGFVSQVCRLVLTKNACRGASERGERTRSPRSPSWACFFSAGLPAGLSFLRRFASRSFLCTVLGPWPHGHGFRFASLPTCANKNACRGASEGGERTRSPQSPSFWACFLPVC